jgi:hypothetical protein
MGFELLGRPRREAVPYNACRLNRPAYNVGQSQTGHVAVGSSHS